MSRTSGMPDLGMDANTLYLEETFTDQQVGTLRRLTPVTAAGQPDGSRPTLFQGQTQLMTQVGPLPLDFNIEAGSLDEAVARFGSSAQQALEKTLRDLEEMRRESASSLIIPGGGGPAGGPLGGGPLGGGRGGKILR